MGTTEPGDIGAKSWQEQLAEQFYTWELRGRGWQMWDLPVEPEPAFAPFFGYQLNYGNDAGDDGRKDTLISGAFNWLHRKLTGQGNPTAQPEPQDEEEPEPELWGCDDGLVELQVALPPTLQVSKDAAAQFLLSLGSCRQTPAFEIVGTPERVTVQIACGAEDAGNVRQQLEAHFLDVTVTPRSGFLEQHWAQAEEGETIIAELGLAREFMLPLASPRGFSIDPLTAIVAVLSDITAGELGLLQVLFRPVRRPWAESVLRSVVFADGTPLFDGVRDYLRQAKAKVSSPLYGAVVRVAVRSGEENRAFDLARRLAGAMAHLNSTEGNELIPLANDLYEAVDHEDDVLLRRSRRGGMLLNSEELISLVHLPSASIRVGKLRGPMKKTKSAPSIARNGRIVLGQNEHAGDVCQVALTPDQRTRHVHVIGASGTGKSTLLLNLILQDIAADDGVALLDPHGDLIDDVIARIPRNRIDDVVLVDPGDEDYPIGLNVLTAHSALEKNLLASDLVSVFKRLSTSWGDQMHSVLGNAILAFLESSRGGTLLDLRRFLVEPAYRKEFLTEVQDPEVAYYWSKEFPLLTGRPQGPVLTRLDTFLRPKSIRYMVAQKQSKLDFADIMDSGKIFLARLSHGAIGEENAYLLGTLLVSKFHQLALGRQRMHEAERKHFWLYVDEFQNFATPSMASILSGARKYRLGLVLAHHEMRQLESTASDVAGAVMAHPYTRVCFRLGDDDARKLATGFKSFDTADLQNLSTGEAICRIERADLDFNLQTLPAPAFDRDAAAEVRQMIIANTRERYAVPRGEIEVELSRQREKDDSAASETPGMSRPKREKTEIVASAAPVNVDAPRPPLIARKPDLSPRKAPKPEPREPADMGRGGPQHKYIQRLIKQYGEGLGYLASIEEPVLGSRGVDVGLVKEGISIACEICVTTDDAHELENVRKCLSGGYTHVAVVSDDGRRLRKLQAFVEAQVTDSERDRVRFFLPQDLLAFIQALEVGRMDKEKKVRGYTVKTTFKPVDGMEGQQRRQAVSKVVAKAMTRLSERKKKKS